MDATWAWVGLAVYVLIYDTWALASGRETMSGAFGRAIAHPTRRWLVTIIWTATTLHLFGRLPRNVDPFARYAYLLAILGGRRANPCRIPTPGL